MNLSNDIIKVLDHVSEKIGLQVDWAQYNTTPYIKELSQKLINWEISTSILWIVISVIIMLIAIIAFVIMFKKENLVIDDKVLLVVMMLLINIIPFIAICIQTHDIIECKVFPEKYIYEYIKTEINRQ